MRNRAIGAATALLAVLGSCNSRSGESGSSGGGIVNTSLTGNLALLDHSPGDRAVQVPLDAAVRLRFDAVVVSECLQDEETWLRIAGDAEDLPGNFTFEDGGRVAVFTPATPLREETDYEVQISPLTCDHAGRILEQRVRFSFRTFDERPPSLAGANVVDGQTGVNRLGAFRLTFNEPLAASSVDENTVYLRDLFGSHYPVALSVAGAEVVVQPHADLAGSRRYVLVAAGGQGGITDRAGNLLPSDWSATFTAAADNVAPHVLSIWPEAPSGVSPRAHPLITFDESMDPHSVENASVLFQDGYGNQIPFRVHASLDHRTLRLQTLKDMAPNREYTLALLGGIAGATDLAGNALAASAVVQFSTGTDAQAPEIESSLPAANEQRVSTNAIVAVRFDEPLDPRWVHSNTVALDDGGGPVACVVETTHQGHEVRVTPVLPLRTGTRHVLKMTGDHLGIRDQAGNVLAGDRALEFTTTSDPTPPTAILQPADGSIAVPAGARFAAVFDEPLDPSTVNTGTVVVRDGVGSPVAGTVALERSNRVVSFSPTAPWQSGAWYTVTLQSGPDGVREESGSWLSQELQSRFRAGLTADTVSPVVTVTLNGTDNDRKDGMSVPPSGFSVDVAAFDPGDLSLDSGSFEVLIAGPASAPTIDAIFATAEVGYDGLSYVLPAVDQLDAGEYTLTVRVADLSGNWGSSPPLDFEVTAPSLAALPFERTQVVWVRTDLDRDGSGTPDFEDDLMRLGLLATGDPASTNARMRQIMLEGIFSQAYQLMGRAPDGALLGPDSVAIRLSHREPIGVAHMQMGLGGFDPAGPRDRGFGDESTGVLGRAFYDFRNSNVNERNISNAPALGVFPAEMYLFQTNLHLQVFPSFLTTFATRFVNLCPDMGGTPAGAHRLDAQVLAVGFDPLNAPSAQRARFTQVFDAADDWATVIGVILAHEIGHSVGLVAPGVSPRGLFGDLSLHNEFSAAAEVMASAVGYDSMVVLDYRFRDVNAAYLRQRLLLK